MRKLETSYYLQKRIVQTVFGEKWYGKIQLFKHLFDYKLGKPFEISPLFKYFLTKDSIVFDIGANVGQYACRLHDIVESGNGLIYSFEPVTANFNSLKRMKKLLNLNNLTINKLAISNISGYTVINIPVFNNGLVVGTRSTLLNIDGIKHRKEPIKVTTIDKYVNENGIKKINFIKCDTEGNEINVLEGGKRTITKYLPILSFEMSYKNDEINWLLDLGYELFYHDVRVNKLRKINGNQNGNLIFLHRGHLKKLSEIIE